MGGSHLSLLNRLTIYVCHFYTCSLSSILATIHYTIDYRYFAAGIKLFTKVLSKILSGIFKLIVKGGGGGGVHPDFFVKLDFEIAVDQQTRAHNQTFEGVPDSGCPRDNHAHIW